MTGSLRRIVKAALAYLIFYSGLLNLYLHLRRKLSPLPDLTVLMYHQVLNTEHSRENHLPAGMVTLENTFDRQMEYLKKHFNVITLDESIRRLRDERNLPPRSVVITFDDGWRDNYLFALPVLKKHDLPATIFLSTEYISTSRVFWFHVVSLILKSGSLSPRKRSEILNGFGQISLEEKRAIVESSVCADAFVEKLKKIKPHIQEKIIVDMIKESHIQMSEVVKRRMMLDWDEIEEMCENRISFGSHGRSHRILTHLDSAEIKTELTESKRAIEEKTKRPVSFFAYPNGDYTPPIKELVKQTGYLCACTVESGEKSQDEMDLFALPRMAVHEGVSIGTKGGFSKALFACHIAGLFVRRRRKYEQSVGD